MTVWEIAKRANVSIATVSRVINGVGNVDPSLARRVRRIVAELGYYPNTHARALVSGRSRTLGLVLDLVNPFFSEIVQTFTELGFDYDYGILLSPLTRDARSLRAAVRQMSERRVDGLAVMSSASENAFIEAFTGRNIPCVAVDIDHPGGLLKTIRIDYEHGIRQAVQHLAALGHARIAFIGGSANSKSAASQKIAFQKCRMEIGLGISPQLLMAGDHSIESGTAGMTAMAALPERPSAVVCSHDETAIGVIRRGFELGIQIPGELSVVGFHDIRMGQYLVPPLTTVQIPQIEIAEAAFGALLDFVSAQPRESSSSSSTIKTNLVLRCSTALGPDRTTNNP
jgi:LacI family transcriptional regulator